MTYQIPPEPPATFRPYEFISELFDQDVDSEDRSWLQKLVPAFERHLNWSSSAAAEQLSRGPNSWWLLRYCTDNDSLMEHFVAESGDQALACLMSNIDTRCLAPTAVSPYEDGLAVWRGDEVLAWAVPFKATPLGDELRQRCAAVFRGVSRKEFRGAANRLKKLPALQHLLAGPAPGIEMPNTRHYEDSAMVFEPGDAAQRFVLLARELGREMDVAQARAHLAALFQAKDWHQVMARWSSISAPQPYEVEDMESGEVLFAGSVEGALGCLELLARKREPGWAAGHNLQVEARSWDGGRAALYVQKFKELPEHGTDLVDENGWLQLSDESPYALEARTLVTQDEHQRVLDAAQRIAARPREEWPGAVAQELRVGLARDEQLRARDWRRSAAMTGSIGSVRFATSEHREVRRPLFVMESLDDHGEATPCPEIFGGHPGLDMRRWNVHLPAYKTEGHYVRGSLMFVTDYARFLSAFFEDLPLEEARLLCEAHEMQFRVEDELPHLKEEQWPIGVREWAKRVGL